jgi:hypothetical protein
MTIRDNKKSTDAPMAIQWDSWIWQYSETQLSTVDKTPLCDNTVRPRHVIVQLSIISCYEITIFFMYL